MLSKFVFVLLLATMTSSTDTSSVNDRRRTSRSVEITSEIADAVVEAHNKIRANVQPEAANMIKLVYNQELEDLARVWARNCYWDHSSQDSRRTTKYSYAGENLRYAFPSVDTKSSLVDAVKSWASEVKDYDFNSNYCAPGRMCGHYTQVVWADTESVGCAVHICPKLTRPRGTPVSNAQYVVCNYGPGGNYNGRKPYIAGASGSKCPAGKECLEGAGSAAAANARVSYVVMTITAVAAVLITFL